MILLDFDSSSRQAFTQGFLKGLGAPLVLFGGFQAPSLPAVAALTVPAQSPMDALAQDWARIGLDMHCAVNHYGEECKHA